MGNDNKSFGLLYDRQRKYDTKPLNLDLKYTIKKINAKVTL